MPSSNATAACIAADVRRDYAVNAVVSAVGLAEGVDLGIDHEGGWALFSAARDLAAIAADQLEGSPLAIVCADLAACMARVPRDAADPVTA